MTLKVIALVITLGCCTLSEPATAGPLKVFEFHSDLQRCAFYARGTAPIPACEPNLNFEYYNFYEAVVIDEESTKRLKTIDIDYKFYSTIEFESFANGTNGFVETSVRTSLPGVELKCEGTEFCLLFSFSGDEIITYFENFAEGSKADSVIISTTTSKSIHIDETVPVLKGQQLYFIIEERLTQDYSVELVGATQVSLATIIHQYTTISVFASFVPEASTWAQMIAGLFFVGGLVRRRGRPVAC